MIREELLEWCRSAIDSGGFWHNSELACKAARALRDRLEAEGGDERNIAEELMDIGQHSGMKPSAEAQQCGPDSGGLTPPRPPSAQSQGQGNSERHFVPDDPDGIDTFSDTPSPNTGEAHSRGAIPPEPARVTELAAALYEFEPIAEEDEGQVYTFSELASEMPNVHAVYLRRATSIIARFGNRLGEDRPGDGIIPLDSKTGEPM